MTRVVIFTRLTTRPGTRDEVVEAFAPLLATVATEPGTEVFEMWAARDEPDVLVFHEVYRDPAALDAHRESAALRDLVDRLPALLAGPPEVTYAVPVSNASSAATDREIADA